MNITSLNISNTDAFENAYILSHNGLGDNIVMNGAINFLLNYYNNVYFLVKDIYYDQINYLYCDNSNVIVINFDSKNENASCYNILCDKYKNNDIFISGSHKSYLKSQITNDKLKMYIRNNKYNLPERFQFITMFYNDIGLDLSIFLDYFNIDKKDYQQIYHPISNYNIIFIHSSASNVEMDFSSIINKYLNIDNILIICANKNVYSNDNNKFDIAEKYVFLPTVFCYTEIIKNSIEIYASDSCISCIIIPLFLKKQLKCNYINIFNRETNEKVHFSDFVI